MLPACLHVISFAPVFFAALCFYDEAFVVLLHFNYLSLSLSLSLCHQEKVHVTSLDMATVLPKIELTSFVVDLTFMPHS